MFLVQQKHALPINLGRDVQCKVMQNMIIVIILFINSQLVNLRNAALPRIIEYKTHSTAITITVRELILPLCRVSYSLFCEFEHLFTLYIIQLFPLWVTLQPKRKFLSKSDHYKYLRMTQRPISERMNEKKTVVVTQYILHSHQN